MTARPMPRSRVALLAAVAFAVAAATAADARPRKEQPPSASSPCERYGPGYRPLAGTDTCVKISGNVRVEMGLVSGGSGGGVGAYLDRPRR